MRKFENSVLLAPVRIPTILVAKLDKCVASMNKSNPINPVSRATLVRISIQRFVEAFEAERKKTC